MGQQLEQEVQTCLTKASWRTLQTSRPRVPQLVWVFPGVSFSLRRSRVHLYQMAEPPQLAPLCSSAAFSPQRTGTASSTLQKPHGLWFCEHKDEPPQILIFGELLSGSSFKGSVGRRWAGGLAGDMHSLKGNMFLFLSGSEHLTVFLSWSCRSWWWSAAVTSAALLTAAAFMSESQTCCDTSRLTTAPLDCIMVFKQAFTLGSETSNVFNVFVVSVLSKSGPMGAWRRAKTEVSQNLSPARRLPPAGKLTVRFCFRTSRRGTSKRTVSGAGRPMWIGRNFVNILFCF